MFIHCYLMERVGLLFKGSLREQQDLAAERLLTYSDGVLSGGRRIVDFNCNGTEYWRRI